MIMMNKSLNDAYLKEIEEAEGMLQYSPCCNGLVTYRLSTDTFYCIDCNTKVPSFLLPQTFIDNERKNAGKLKGDYCERKT